MRAAWVALLAVAGALLVLATTVAFDVWPGGSAMAAAMPGDGHGSPATPVESTPIVADDDAPRREPTPPPEPDPEIVGLPPPLVLRLQDRATHAALPPVPAWLYWYGPPFAGGRKDTAEVGADGSVVLARDDLLAATGLQLELELPELAAGTAVKLPEVATLAGRTEPVVVEVDRGRARALQVVDADGHGVAGATVSDHLVLEVVTDADGRAEPVLPVPPPLGLSVCATGRRFVWAETPPEDQSWRVVLPLANRLEVELTAGADPRGLHVEVLLSAAFSTRTFYQSHYVQTPGRAVEGTPGFWDGPYRGASVWHLGFAAAGLAVLDQLDDAGEATVELWRFGDLLERRIVQLPIGGGVTRLQLDVPPAPVDLRLRALDEHGAPRAGVVVRMGLPPEAVLDASLQKGLPVWAPRATTDDDGRARLPAAAGDVCLACAGDGLAVTVLTVDELLAAHGDVVLANGHALQMWARDRNGEQMIENACGNPACVEPRALLRHGRWLSAGYDNDSEAFRFVGLPPGDVEFHFTWLDEVLHHDPRVPTVHFRSRHACDELDLGK